MIAEHLNRGAQNAITGRELCALLGIDSRKLRLHVEHERRQGYPICASTCTDNNPGYYLADSQAELDAYLNKLWKRAGEIHKTRRAMQEVIIE